MFVVGNELYGLASYLPYHDPTCCWIKVSGHRMTLPDRLVHKLLSWPRGQEQRVVSNSLDVLTWSWSDYSTPIMNRTQTDHGHTVHKQTTHSTQNRPMMVMLIEFESEMHCSEVYYSLSKNTEDGQE